MATKWIFWETPFSLTGPATAEDVLARIRGQVSGGRLGAHDRLSGKVDGNRVRVWRRPALAASDVVQFEGVVRPDGHGVIVDGRLRYTLATRLQFAGSLVLGVALIAGGALGGSQVQEGGLDLLETGVVISALAVIWIYSSMRMRGTQIDFLKSRLAESVAAPAEVPPSGSPQP